MLAITAVLVIITETNVAADPAIIDVRWFDLGRMSIYKMQVKDCPQNSAAELALVGVPTRPYRHSVSNLYIRPVGVMLAATASLQWTDCSR